jgi:hypothetical protein
MRRVSELVGIVLTAGVIAASVVFLSGTDRSSGGTAPPAAAVDAAGAPQAHPCDRQAWPYLDRACLQDRKAAESGARQVRVVSVHAGAPRTLTTASPPLPPASPPLQAHAHSAPLPTPSPAPVVQPEAGDGRIAAAAGVTVAPRAESRNGATTAREPILAAAPWQPPAERRRQATRPRNGDARGQIVTVYRSYVLPDGRQVVVRHTYRDVRDPDATIDRALAQPRAPILTSRRFAFDTLH